MKVSNFESNSGNKVANQFLITDGNKITFQSYNSIIAIKDEDTNKVTLDSKFWNYSKTTAKYRNLFLGESTKEIERKIKEGIYILDNLN